MRSSKSDKGIKIKVKILKSSRKKNYKNPRVLGIKNLGEQSKSTALFFDIVRKGPPKKIKLTFDKSRTLLAQGILPHTFTKVLDLPNRSKLWGILKVRDKFSFMKKSLVKIIALILIIALNWTGLSAVIETFAYMNDTENSSENSYSASTLDFSLSDLGDFSPEVTPTQTAARNINVINDGILGFQYTASTTNVTGDLCNYLNLEAKLDETTTYTGSLTGFNYNVGEFSTSTNDWQFTATLTSNDPALENETCTFDFVFDGVQIDGMGFSDQETISNTITSGEWTIPPPALKINEVYYDVLETRHCKEEKNEWVEIYNPTTVPVNLKDWQICHGYGAEAVCNRINPNKTISSLGFAVVGHDNSTWVHCFPAVPPEAVIIHQLGGPWPDLGNDGDYIILKDPSGIIVDCVSWGNDPNTCNFPDGTVNDVLEGHSIARITAGVDTDTAADWEDLSTPNPGTNPHGEEGEIIIEEEIEASISEETSEEETATSTEEPIVEELVIEESTSSEINSFSLPILEVPAAEEPAPEPIVPEPIVNEETTSEPAIPPEETLSELPLSTSENSSEAEPPAETNNPPDNNSSPEGDSNLTNLDSPTPPAPENL